MKRTVLFAAKVAALLTLILVGALAAILLLHYHLAGHEPHEMHDAFHRGVGWIGLAGLAVVAAVTVLLARPLRRMSASMDRIAAGDLEHRVAVRGGDEVAAMGRSFNAMADRIGAMVRGQRELLAAVSHELRSPLARMKVALELLREQAPATRVDQLEAEVDALDALVGELLLASRFELGAMPLDTRPLALEAIVRESWALAAETAGERAAATALSLALDERAAHVDADRALLLRVFRNLLENALRYAAGGTVTVSSRPLEGTGDGRVEIAVADDGPGIDADRRARLFEPFYRADPARARDTGGVGLGLMIVRRAVEAHGGTVRAEAAETAHDGGLAVIFDLPATSTRSDGAGRRSPGPATGGSRRDR